MFSQYLFLSISLMSILFLTFSLFVLSIMSILSELVYVEYSILFSLSSQSEMTSSHKLFFNHNNIKLQMNTNYKLHEMKKAKRKLNKTQNSLKGTWHLKLVLYIYLNQIKLKYIGKVSIIMTNSF